MIRTDEEGGHLLRNDAAEKEISSLSVFNKKVASLNKEYTAMLASTLESQRVFFQESLSKLQVEAQAVLESKRKEILEQEQALGDLDAEVEAQLAKVD